jgi:hypothetical protein
LASWLSSRSPQARLVSEPGPRVRPAMARRGRNPADPRGRHGPHPSGRNRKTAQPRSAARRSDRRGQVEVSDREVAAECPRTAGAISSCAAWPGSRCRQRVALTTPRRRRGRAPRTIDRGFGVGAAGARWSLRCGAAHHFAHQTAWHGAFAMDGVDAVDVVTWRDVTVWTESTVVAGPQSLGRRFDPSRAHVQTTWPSCSTSSTVGLRSS